MFNTLANAFKVKEIRQKILFTLLMLVIIRIGSLLPIPGVNTAYFTSLFNGEGLGLMNAMSGGALSQGSVFALGVSPYITSSIIVQLLTIAIPALEEMQKDGVKILGNGELTKKLTVKANAFSAKAKEKIEALGGTCEVI